MTHPACRRILTLYAALILAAALLQTVGCGTSNPYPVGTFERGQFFRAEEMYAEAVSALDNFIRHNPTDSLAAQAQFDKAMTYMEMEEYPLAAVEFQILRKDYPTCPLVEEAAFQEGVAYLRQVDRIERDITGAYEARLQFLRFAQDYPSSVFMPQVVDHMRDISDLMVRKRLEQVRVYRQLRQYEAAAKVLDDLLVEEAGSTLVDEVLLRRAKIAMKLEDRGDRPASAPATLRRLSGIRICVRGHPDPGGNRRPGARPGSGSGDRVVIRAVLGGSFDPVHDGHLAMVDYVLARRLADCVIVVPAWRSPHKSTQTTAADHRLAMVELAFAGRDRVAIDGREMAAGRVVYTVDTLAALQAEAPDEDLRLVVGADQLAAFDRWRDPERILDLAELVVLARDGYVLDLSHLSALPRAEKRIRLCPDFHEPVASSRIRAMFDRGEIPEAYLPAAVMDYIRRYGLYGV